MSNPTEKGKAETERQEEAAEQQPKAANSGGGRLGGLISFIVGIIMLSPFSSGSSISISSVDSLFLILLGFGLVLVGIVVMIFGRWSHFFWW